MSTLIFDIETVGEKWDELDEVSKGVLTRWIDRASRREEEKTAALKDLKEGLGFSPLTGEIVAIGLYDLERELGVVYYQTKDEAKDEEVESFMLKPRSEKEMLKDFWDGACEYDTFVTFNGRGFDVPYMNIRSAVHNIRPSRDLMDGRYLYQQKLVRHIDLLDQLTYYGAVYKKPSLHMFCRAFGIESPKAAGVSGDDVAELFETKKFRDIALYNVKDVVATTELYVKWLDHLAPETFRRTT